ncbi:hypothetical protein L596_025355 [Steinernema carpocapsae]|uniref:Uncharacterized protein n=1 Tax=Steinernema carpocapsae TaxID=34508 RepID=A0A4U5M7J4_STECR|nr:hypothetical protein L596_025355 [Steinernema carpocapsae]
MLHFRNKSFLRFSGVVDLLKSVRVKAAVEKSRSLSTDVAGALRYFLANCDKTEYAAMRTVSAQYSTGSADGCAGSDRY